MLYSNDKFIKRIAAFVAHEVRTDLEVGGIKRPKIDFLVSISEAIVLLLEHLYPLSEQIQLINNIDKSFSISDTTYYRFLKEHLFNSYELHRKNRFFAAKTIEIKRLIGMFPNQYELQYSHLSLNTKESITFADYLHFINHYYSPQAEAFFNKRALKLQPTIIKGVVPNPNDGGETYLNVTVEEPADNIASVVSDIKKEVVAIMPEIQKPAEKISSGNYSKVGQWKVYEKNEDRYALKYTDGGYYIDLMPDSTVEELPKLWEIVTDRNEFPREIQDDFSFLYGKYNRKTQGFDEDYIYFNHIDFVQYANPNTYGLVDRLLFITATAYDEGKIGYLLYRYYKGKIYFIENLVLPKVSATLTRATRHWYENNITADFGEFMKELLAYKRKCDEEKLGKK